MSNATWPIVAGWSVNPTADYAQPSTAGGGYVELDPESGRLEVAYETDQAARDMGLDAHLVTRVPVDVLRALVATYDARDASPATMQLRGAAREIARGVGRLDPSDAATKEELARALDELAKAVRGLGGNESDTLLARRPTLTAEERHQALDVTLAGYLVAHPGKMPSQVSVLDLARWHAAEMAGGS